MYSRVIIFTLVFVVGVAIAQPAKAISLSELIDLFVALEIIKPEKAEMARTVLATKEAETTTKPQSIPVSKSVLRVINPQPDSEWYVDEGKRMGIIWTLGRVDQDTLVCFLLRNETGKHFAIATDDSTNCFPARTGYSRIEAKLLRQSGYDLAPGTYTLIARLQAPKDGSGKDRRMVEEVLIGNLEFIDRSEVAQSVGEEEKVEALAQCLAQVGTTFYGAFWCPHCNEQKALFAEAADSLPYVECSTDDRASQVEVCNEANITSYPTWITQYGERLTGVQSLETLADKSACEAVFETGDINQALKG